MGEGLRPHHHVYYEVETKYYHDHVKQCSVKNTTFRCMICGKEYHERYEYKPPPEKERSNRILENNKKKFSNRK